MRLRATSPSRTCRATGQSAGKRQRPRLVDAAGNGASHHIGGERTQLRQAMIGSASGRAPVAPANTMSPSSGVCTGRSARAMPSCAMIASRRVCALVRAASVATTTSVVFSPGWPLAWKARASCGTEAGRPRPPNSLPRSKGAAQKCGPPPITAEPTALTTASAPTVMPSARLRRGRAKTALEVDDGGAEPCADAAEGEVRRGGSGRRIAEFAIGRIAAPVLVAAVQQIEQDRRRHDRHARVADLKAAAVLAEPRLGAGGGVEAERRAAGQRDGVDALDRHRRIEQRAFARARSAAANVGRRDRGLVEQHDGRARAELGIVGMADADAGNVGDEISSQASSLQRAGREPYQIKRRSHHRQRLPLRLRQRAAPCI